jgi:GNAT superfamily N-acetyltransferase
MEISIREWEKKDLPKIQESWLDYCRNAARSDMHFKPDYDKAMEKWLLGRFRLTSSIGYVAETDGQLAGFLIARVDDWESIPPVIEPRRIGIIDAVYVAEEFRRQGIASRLVERAIQLMEDAKVDAIETIYDAWNDASARTWRRAGFAPWMVHAYRML